MNNEMKKEGTWKDWISVVIVLVIIIAGVLYYNYSLVPVPVPTSDGNVSESNSANTLVDNNTGILIENSTNDTVLVIDKDGAFKNTLEVDNRVIYEDLVCISNAAKNKNFDETARCGRLLSDAADAITISINNSKVSPSLQTVLDDYKKSLKDYNVGGEMLETGAIYRNATQMNEAGMYIQNGTVRITKIVETLYGNSTSNLKYIHEKATNNS